MSRRLVVLILAVAGILGAQSRVFELRDNNGHIYTWDIGANLGASATITGPILPLNGGTMTGPLTIATPYGSGLRVPLGTNIEAVPDSGSHQFLGNCTSPPAWSSGTTYALGDIASSGGTTYTSIANSNTNHTPPNVSWWTPACVDDRARFDWFGMEGDFFRIKGKGTTTIGDYFDWTRFGTSAALPLHQVNLNDSGFNTLLHIDESGGLTSTNFDFSGLVRFGLNTSVDVGLTRNSANVLEVNNGTAGTFANLWAAALQANTVRLNNGSDYFDFLTNTLGTHRFQIRDSSANVILDYQAGAVWNVNGNFSFTAGISSSLTIQSSQTGTNVAFQVNGGSGGQWLGNGTFNIGLVNIATAGTIDWNAQAALRYNGGHLQGSDDGSTWVNLTTGGGGGGPPFSTSLTFTGDNTYDVGAYPTNRIRSLYVGTGISSPLVRLQTSADYFDLTQDGTAHHLDLLDSSANPLISYRNATANWYGGTWTVEGITVIDGSLQVGGTHFGNPVIFAPASTNFILLSSNTGGASLQFGYGSPSSYSLGMIMDGATGVVNIETGLNVVSGMTIGWNSQAALRYSGGHLQGSDNGSTWVNLTSGGGGGPPFSSNLTFTSDNTYTVGSAGASRPSTVYAATGIDSPLYRVNNGSDYFDLMNTGLGTHAFDLRDSGNNPILTYRNGIGSYNLGTYTLNANDLKMQDPIHTYVFAALTNSSSGSGTNFRGRLTLSDEPTTNSIIADANYAGGGNPVILMNGTPGVTKTCTVLPTVVGGIITSC